MSELFPNDYLFDPRYRTREQVLAPPRPVDTRSPYLEQLGSTAGLAASVARNRKPSVPPGPPAASASSPATASSEAPPPALPSTPAEREAVWAGFKPGWNGVATAPGSNNPGNVTDGKGGFQSYPDPVAGVRGTIQTVRSYPGKYNNGAPMSLNHVAEYWAPGPQPGRYNTTPRNPNDPMIKGNDPVAWARNVSAVMGVSPDAPLDFSDPKVAALFARGAHVAEYGQAAQYDPSVYDQGAY